MASVTYEQIADLMIAFPNPGSAATTTLPAVKRNRVEQQREEAYVANLYLRPTFQAAENSLERMRKLLPNWDTYGAEPLT